MGNTSKDQTIKTLVEKRRELLAELNALRSQEAKIIGDLSNLDTTILMFAPNMELEKIMPAHMPPLHQAGRGEIGMMLLDILRQEGGPLSSAEINLRIMKRRNLNVNDGPLVRTMADRVRSALRVNRERGRVRSVRSADGRQALWEIAS